MPFQLIVFIGAIALAAVSGFGSAWKIQNWRHDAVMLEIEQANIVAKDAQLETDRLRRTKVDTASQAHEETKVVIETKFKTITKEVERVVNKIEYRNAAACLDDDGLRVANESIATTGTVTSAGPQPAHPVPATSAAR